MAQKNMTIETLAEMINEGFKSTASKEDIQRVEVRLDRIENLLIEEQRRKIENLEMRMKKLGRGARPCRNAREACHLW
jgi:hypothetical protein